MINYNQNDLVKYKDWEEILEYFKLEPVDDQEVWDIARESKKIPLMENILLALTANRIINYLEEHYPEHKYDYFINSIDSHLYCDDEEFYNVEDLPKDIQ